MANYPQQIPRSMDDKRYIMGSDSDIDMREANTEIAMTPRCFRSFQRILLSANLFMLISSLILMGTGAGLMGFYRLHMLDVISAEFLFVPIFMIGGGAITLLLALYGFYANIKDSPCMLITYAVMLASEMLVLLVAVGAAIHLTWVIKVGIFDADVIPELTNYQIDPLVRYKWDTLQYEFSCCGGYGYTLGYTDWKHTVIGGAHNAVPDSCCLVPAPGCGHNVFDITDIRVVIGKIHTHGCLTTLQRRLDTHVMIILMVFAAVGGLLALLELLMVVLSCCMAGTSSEPDLDPNCTDSDMTSIGGGTLRRSTSRHGSLSRSRSLQRMRTNSFTNPSMDLDMAQEHHHSGYGKGYHESTRTHESTVQHITGNSCDGMNCNHSCRDCVGLGGSRPTSRPTSPISEPL